MTENKLDMIYLFFTILGLILCAHIVLMSLCEFFTWGQAVWDIGKWKLEQRVGWLIYIIAFMFGFAHYRSK